MVPFTRCGEVLDLGKRIVEQLDAGDDLLASWMAHRVAESIVAARSRRSSGKVRAKARDEATRLILDLWERRRVWPRDQRPFAKLEPLLEVLASLHVDSPTPRYPVLRARPRLEGEALDEETAKLMELTLGLDSTARILIHWCLRAIAERGGGVADAETWVERARRAGLEAIPEAELMDYLLTKRTEVGKSTVQSLLDARLTRLDAFIDMARGLADGLRSSSTSVGPRKRSDPKAKRKVRPAIPRTRSAVPKSPKPMGPRHSPTRRFAKQPPRGRTSQRV